MTFFIVILILITKLSSREFEHYYNMCFCFENANIKWVLRKIEITYNEYCF